MQHENECEARSLVGWPFRATSLIDHASGIHKLIVIAQDWIAELIDLSFVYLMRLLIFKKKIIKILQS